MKSAVSKLETKGEERRAPSPRPARNSQAGSPMTDRSNHILAKQLLLSHSWLVIAATLGLVEMHSNNFDKIFNVPENAELCAFPVTKSEAAMELISEKYPAQADFRVWDQHMFASVYLT
ncbi:hypothetical protein Pmani_028098 [Petrolisthes manimaculis]|uniref:Uncharacterized protein n=1 Tax=Petrolisthes manimaculis TaxID=1843537 RepID=A0AAE1P260_9EUCA|nr:hypothetical protein Pmani_028098 [Petrolisthes manimaculis]